jgi:CDP-paratose 2-epimerase
MRATFFGPDGDTRWNQRRLENQFRRFHHHELDIRDRNAVLNLFSRDKFDLIIHCAAQPSHDKAKEIPFTDF